VLHVATVGWDPHAATTRVPLKVQSVESATVGWDPHAATTRVPLKVQSVESGVGARGK
jgi:ABC-type proline/glycine betaine transport system substrate-binding protein